MEDFSTLLLGETGTGKGQAAAAIGRSGFIPYLPDERRFAANFTETFIAINLSQFPETLIESELFGHRKGAFTGAIDHHQGVFERCSAHGALFLDEIGEVAIPVQIKLLQVLQERTFTPLGGREKKRFSGRVIAATNRPLDRLRSERRFRDDFFYRLCSDVIEMPTLRQRLAESSAEIETWCACWWRASPAWRAPSLADRVLEQLEASVPRGYPWPGNVRELEQAVRRILLTGRYAPDPAAPARTRTSCSGEGARRRADRRRAPRPLLRHAVPPAGHLRGGGQAHRSRSRAPRANMSTTQDPDSRRRGLTGKSSLWTTSSKKPGITWTPIAASASPSRSWRARSARARSTCSAASRKRSASRRATTRMPSASRR